ncbi:MAG: tRNA (adenosine(37)-N6)-threonylcarbamoyltransferase complex dimerization subunit type 1 TsaB [Erysipelotrichaceae bacterium]|nr:tRNA (adenosine(37)-N6)-threonylcarbamoyltransferase complex dimerization subunit type 1 TsaB [Erysipelotrichaceae bacterium]
MYSLFVDTSYKYLTVAIEKDNKIVSSYSEECFKRQSEQLFVVIEELFKEAKLDKKLIEAVYITEGPGSYTGVRIAMTLAKVLCEIRNIKLYTISSLKLYAGGKANTMVLMDARANRAYVGIYDEGKCLLEDTALSISEIDPKDYNVVLDGQLIGKVFVNPNIVECFLNTKDSFVEVDNINHLTPKYLKESDAYYR